MAFLSLTRNFFLWIRGGLFSNSLNSIIVYQPITMVVRFWLSNQNGAFLGWPIRMPYCGWGQSKSFICLHVGQPELCIVTININETHMSILLWCPIGYAECHVGRKYSCIFKLKSIERHGSFPSSSVLAWVRFPRNYIVFSFYGIYIFVLV